MASSNDAHTTRRRNNRNRQAALSFLSTIKLDPSADHLPPQTHQQTQELYHHKKSSPEGTAVTTAAAAQPSTSNLAVQKQQQDAPSRLHAEGPLVAERPPMTVSSPVASPIASPISPRLRPSVDQSRPQYGKREQTAVMFLSGIKLRADEDSNTATGSANKPLDEHAGSPTPEKTKDDHAKRHLASGQHGQDDSDSGEATPKFEPSGPVTPRLQPARRSISTPSLYGNDRQHYQEILRSGDKVSLDKTESAAKKNGSQSHNPSPRAQRSRLTPQQERSDTVPNFVSAQRPGNDHHRHLDTHAVSPRHSHHHRLIKPSTHWLTPFASTANIRSLAGHASSTIARKLFRRPSFSLPRRIHRSRTRRPASKGGLSRTRSPSSLQSSASFRERRARRMTEDERHIIYHGSEFAMSNASLEENLNHHAVLFTTNGGSPLMLSSIIRYQDDKAPNKNRRRRINREYLQQITKEALIRKKANSFAYLLTQSHALSPDLQEPSDYDPYFLDDPELKTGKNRTVISLACYMGSVIQYTRPSDLKRELNEHFRNQHPNIDPSITLSKIRKIKSDLLAISEDLDLEISTVALSYAYFEKLILKGSKPESDTGDRPSEPRQPLVTKENRKLVACVCLLLAYKINEPKRPAGEFSELMKTMYKYMFVAAKDIKDHEFQVFAQLDFNLNLPRQEVLPHFEQILYRQDYLNVQEYIGEDVDFFAVAPQSRKVET
ncbi:CDK5 and ABL1 enzyme substrate 1 [Actinomortierella wolfii]|nr:CDK5 and ABL1 enzyme substrate 1 [Actinomortierella wolfii]